MRYRTMPNESFEFTTDKLSYGIIEDRILGHYDLGCANSSNFMDLSEGRSSSLAIDAEKGIIEFTAIVSKKSDGSYAVICYPQSVKKKM